MKHSRLWILASLYMTLAACGSSPSAKKESTQPNCVNCEKQKSSSDTDSTSQNETKVSEPTPEEIATAEEAATNPSSGKGFFTVNSEEIPGAVRKSALSLFHVVVLSHRADDETYLNVSTQNLLDEAREKAKALPVKNLKDQIQKKILARILSVCAAHADVRIAMQCPVPKSFQHLTAFLAHSGDELWTSAESFPDAQQYLTEKKVLSTYVFDSAGEIVINPLKDDVTLLEVNEGFVRLKISKVIGSALTLSKSPVRLAQKIFLAGYPYSGEGADNQGDVAQFSKGHLVDGEKLRAALFENSSDLRRDMIFYSADSDVGSSGSPILNEKGEVIGIHLTGKNKETGRGIKRISVGVRPLSTPAQTSRSESGSASP